MSKEEKGAVIRWRYFIPFVLFLLGLMLVFLKEENPEKLIVGKWKEVEWQYEKTDKKSANRKELKTFPAELKEQIGSEIVIHSAEKWEFLPKNILKLKTQEDSVFYAQWHLKGRGHVLQIKYGDNEVEYYDIKELNDDFLILNYDLGMEIKGVAKLIFKRN